LDIKAGKIIVSAVVSGPNDGACCPSVNKTLVYTLRDEALRAHQNWTPLL